MPGFARVGANRLHIAPGGEQRGGQVIHVHAHALHVEFRMELDAPGTSADAESMGGLEGVAGQPDGTGRQSQHRLGVHRVGGEASRHGREQGIGGGGRGQFDGHGADLPAARVIVHMAAQGLGQHLVAETDAQVRHFRRYQAFDPAGETFHPRQPVGDHGVGAGHDHAGAVARFGQVGGLPGIHHAHSLAGQTQAGHQPILEIAEAPHHIRVGSPGLDDIEGARRRFNAGHRHPPQDASPSRPHPGCACRPRRSPLSGASRRRSPGPRPG